MATAIAPMITTSAMYVNGVWLRPNDAGRLVVNVENRFVVSVANRIVVDTWYTLSVGEYVRVASAEEVYTADTLPSSTMLHGPE